MNMYFAALLLPRLLNEKVQPQKEWMRERFSSVVALKSPAHITLLPPFWMNPEQEEAFCSDMDCFASGMTPFTICTNGFDAFRPRTIFIACERNPPLDLLKQASDDFFRNKTQYGLKIDNRPFHPHITIGTRDLHKAAFEEAWLHFEKKPFRECWPALDIAILKHNSRNWDIFHRSVFNRTMKTDALH